MSSMDTTRQTLKIFTEDEIIRITCNYSTLIGKGGFGEVYKGNLDDDYDLVAVKRYIREDLREEFMEEVSIHSQMRHKNVVKLIGYCIGESTLTMVTEYISKGNLDDTLRNIDIPIPLDMRLGIAIGCAEALSYMHSVHLSSDSLICHGDIKPANILLDDNLTAKVSDFGLSRLLSGGITRYTSKVIGSIDYMDPIYLQKGLLTPRSDVYSFGIVLLELITRRRVKEGKFSLIESFGKAYSKWPKLRKLVDAEIAKEENLKVLMEIGKLATSCLSLDIDKRPRMNDVAERLRMLWKRLRGGQDIGWHKKSFGILKWNSGSMETVIKLSNIIIFTKEELNQVTQNYSCPLSLSAELYKGTLHDNTVVVVKKIFLPILRADEGLMLLPQIIHKSIIKLLGCCWEFDTQILVYEYASKGSLASILDGQEEFPLHLRVKVAVKAAEALAYLHSSATGIIKHGNVLPSNILLDNKFTPMLTGFSRARRVQNAGESEEHPYSWTRLIRESEPAPHDSDSYLLRIVLLQDDPVRFHLLETVQEDVSAFGIVLLVLIRMYYGLVGDGEDLVSQFSTAYKVDKSVKAEEITVLKEIRMLALKCTDSEVYKRPTMTEVAERLRMINRSWRERMAKRAKQVTETDL